MLQIKWKKKTPKKNKKKKWLLLFYCKIKVCHVFVQIQHVCSFLRSLNECHIFFNILTRHTQYLYTNSLCCLWSEKRICLKKKLSLPDSIMVSGANLASRVCDLVCPDKLVYMRILVRECDVWLSPFYCPLQFQTFRPDFTSNLVHALAFGTPKFYMRLTIK